MEDSFNRLLSLICEKNPSQRKFLDASARRLEQGELDFLSSYIEYYLGLGHSLEDLAGAYLTIVEDTQREQMYFRRHGRYRHSSFEEVANSVYYDADYMGKHMYGLALTVFLWPNHLKTKRFFEKRLPLDMAGRYLEIGPGHGLFFMTAMRLGRFSSHTGIDVSPTSVQMTRGILKSMMSGNVSDYEIIERDFLKWKSQEDFDAIVMGEVLEHVEAPVDLLRRIASVARSDSFIFVTTCIDSPTVDHITHYTSMKSIADHVHEAGLRIRENLLVPYGDLSLEESAANRLPVTVAMTLEKADE